MSKKYKGKLCVYCQKKPSIRQGDHVFARGFFLESERIKPIKVPSCDSCNNEKSKIEHYLLSLLPFGGLHDHAKENLTQLVPPRLDKNKKLKKTLSTGTKHIWHENLEMGHKSSLVLPLSGQQYTDLFKYIVKALSWYYWGAFINPNTYIYSTSLTETGSKLFKEHFFKLRCQNRIEKIIGNRTFIFTGVQAVDSDQLTIWEFKTYNGLVVASDAEDNFTKSSSVGVITSNQEQKQIINGLFER